MLSCLRQCPYKLQWLTTANHNTIIAWSYTYNMYMHVSSYPAHSWVVGTSISVHGSAQNNSRPSVNFRACCLKDQPQLHLGGYYVQTNPTAVPEGATSYHWHSSNCKVVMSLHRHHYMSNHCLQSGNPLSLSADIQLISVCTVTYKWLEFSCFGQPQQYRQRYHCIVCYT